MAFSEKDYQDGVSQLSLFTSCMFAELTIELEKGGGPLPAIRPDLQFLAERVRLVSQSLLRIYFSAKELDIASNLYYGSFSSHFRQVIKIVTFSQPFDKLPLYVTRKGGARWGKKLLDRPLFWTGRQPIYQDPWDNNTCIGLHMCISVIEKIIAGVLACLNATEGGLRELSPRNLSE
jgi:hypothetical protein